MDKDIYYVYPALLLHEAGREINKENMEELLNTAGLDYSSSKVEAHVQAFENFNIESVLDDFRETEDEDVEEGMGEESLESNTEEDFESNTVEESEEGGFESELGGEVESEIEDSFGDDSE